MFIKLMHVFGHFLSSMLQNHTTFQKLCLFSSLGDQPTQLGSLNRANVNPHLSVLRVNLNPHSIIR
jgi:hypothetical protein